MKIINRIATLLLLFICLFTSDSAFTQPPLPTLPAGNLLDAWSFQNTNWTSFFHEAPLASTNLSLTETWAGNGLLLDSTNPAFLNYAVVTTNGGTNITFITGSVELWFSSDWNSSDGIGNWGTLIEAGNWNTNLAASNGSWGLYLSPDGENLIFAAQSNLFVTNYLSSPIAWNAGDWHYLVLTYSATNSLLYLEGVLVTNGPGVTIWPAPEVLSNGFSVGSDGNGSRMLQARGVYNNLATFNYQLGADDISNDYAYDSQFVYPLPSSGGSHTDDGPPSPPGGGGTNFGGGGSGYTPEIQTYGSNDFWIEALPLGTNAYNTGTNFLTLLLHGTTSDIAYQLLSTTNLNPPVVWTVEQNLIGSETTNFTPATVYMPGRPTLFFKALASTLDSDADGLPDWWEIKYSTTSFPLSPTNADTGSAGIQDGDKQDSAGDGYSNLQKYQMNVPPNVFIAPAAPNNFTATYNTNGNVTLSWSPAANLPTYGAGVVTGYTINLGWTNITVSSTQTNYVLAGDTDLPLVLYGDYPAGPPPTISFEVNYENTNSLSVLNQPLYDPNLGVNATIATGPQGSLYLLASAIPPNVAAIRIYVNPNGGLYGGYPIIGNYNFFFQADEYPYTAPSVFDVPATSITNGIYQIPSSNVPPYGAYYFQTQGIDSNGNLGNLNLAYPFQDLVFDFIPFLDGRTNIQQNINFLLRSATSQYPFSLLAGSSFQYTYSASTNYVFAGYYSYDEYYTGNFQCNEFQPFEENYFYENFIYSTNNVDSYGFLNTGPRDTINPYEFDSTPTYLFPTAYYATNITHPAIPGVLSDTGGLSIYYPGEGFMPAEIGLYDAGGGLLGLSNNCYNIYGLKINSLLYQTFSSPSLALANGGTTFTATSFDDFYFDTATPLLDTVSYYFPRPGIDLQPGQSGFSITNTTVSPMIIPFGQPFVLAAWAKQSLLNGYYGKFAYPQQYFDKAFLADTNGDISTNQTGILSEYGNFFPTQPGKVFLTTKPDAETGSTGQCAIYVVKMQLDVNHDGTMDTSFAGPDNTSAERPFRFWVNDDCDAPAGLILPERDLNNPSTPDYGKQNIPSQRDLEDWTRLWICGLPSLPTNCQATLSWNVISGNPAINLVQPVETNGGTLYLTDTNIAADQSGGTSVFLPSYKFASVTPTNSYTFPLSYLNGTGTNCFLFEGAGVGNGELVLTISQGGSNIMSTSVFLDLNEVRNMFERAVIQNGPASPPYTELSDQSTFKIENYAPVNSNVETNLIVFVHGWRLTDWTSENFAETMFKRLWWQGYKGSFAALRWPTLSWDTDGVEQHLTFNRDEYIAFNCAQGAANYFLQLQNRFPNSSINVAAHSHGNVVMMETLKRLLASGQSPIHNYALLQAAVAAECLDTNAPSFLGFTVGDVTPDSFYGYAGPVQNALSSYNGVSGKMFNFFNTNDFGVVTCWQPDQLLLKPDGRYFYQYLSGTAYQTPVGSSRVITDPHELMSFMSRPTTQAVGAVPGLGGPLNTASQVDLQALVGFTGGWLDHSGEFNRSIQQLNPFYQTLLNDLLQ